MRADERAREQDGPPPVASAPAAPPAPPRELTRDRLVTAAERLFARHGVSGASLREINRLAGAKSPVAVQYHFGDRSGLVRAVMAKHWPAVHTGRNALLDEHEADPSKGLRFLAASLVRPLAAKLADDDGGREFLQIYAELINRPREDVIEAPPQPGDSVQRWRALVAPHLEQDAVRLHRRFTVMRFAAAELGRRAADGPHTDDRLFVSHLIDLVEALLLAGTSEETRRLADDRDVARRG